MSRATRENPIWEQNQGVFSYVALLFFNFYPERLVPSLAGGVDLDSRHQFPSAPPDHFVFSKHWFIFFRERLVNTERLDFLWLNLPRQTGNLQPHSRFRLNFNPFKN